MKWMKANTPKEKKEKSKTVKNTLNKIDEIS
jgi:hypothetical protein